MHYALFIAHEYRMRAIRIRTLNNATLANHYEYIAKLFEELAKGMA